MKNKFKVGDKVKVDTVKIPEGLGPYEIKSNRIYTVSEVCTTKAGMPYVQLKGVYCSYPTDCLMHAEYRSQENEK